MQDLDADAPASLYPLLHPKVRKRAIHAPFLSRTLLLAIATADTSSALLSPLLLLLLVCEEQTRGTLRECVKRHPRVFSSECQERHACWVLHGAEQRVRLFGTFEA